MISENSMSKDLPCSNLRLLQNTRSLILAFVLTLSSITSNAQVPPGTLGGEIRDELGSLIVGAKVDIQNEKGVAKSVITDSQGTYTITSLPPGRYFVRVAAKGFAANERSEVEIAAGQRTQLSFVLTVAPVDQKVDVGVNRLLSTDPDDNADALVLKGKDLDAFSDDPDQLAAALQELAGLSADGTQFFIDGFTGGRVPPKASISEIRINQNPFSAEYDRLGFGRIEVLTRAGTSKFRGQVFSSFSDESLNSRNPFAPNRAPYQYRLYGASISGPITLRSASYFLDFQQRQVDDNAIVNATILNAALNPELFRLAVLTPQSFITLSPRLDYQVDKNNRLTARYAFSHSLARGEGIGELSLPSRAYRISSRQHVLQISETAVISQKILNETRFQYLRERRLQEGEDSEPTIRVLESFVGGGSQVGLSLNNRDSWEFQNNTSWAKGSQSFKAGGRLRIVSLTDVSPQNFAGTFTFSGGLGAQLDPLNEIIRDPVTGQPLLEAITSIERYRRTLLLKSKQLSPQEIRLRGGGANQFNIAGGDPRSSVKQVDLGIFLQDDWRLRKGFTVSAGFRYESQSNIESNLNFAPRIAFAWAPHAGDQPRPKTVIRGGFGIFYSRFGEDLILQARRFDGITQQQFIVRDPDFFPLVPLLATLANTQQPQITRRVAEDLQAPRIVQSSISIERELPFAFSLSTAFIFTHSNGVLRSRNINAPLPDTGVRPLGDLSNVFQYESSGRLNQNQLVVAVNNRLSRKFTLFARYILSKATSDTDGADSFPANQFDLSNEYGRSILDIRHRLFISASIDTLWGINLNPFILASSGRPFNITIGRDTNGDTLFTERPAFALDAAKPGIIVTRFGAFDPNPTMGQESIPRNFASSPSFFTVNLGASRSFSFVNVATPPAAPSARPQSSNQPAQVSAPAAGAPRASEKRFRLTVAAQVQNLFNRTNAGTPIGNLSSPLFGQSIATGTGLRFIGSGSSRAANRRIEAQVRFSF
jgi:hypothetical protein